MLKLALGVFIALHGINYMLEQNKPQHIENQEKEVYIDMKGKPNSKVMHFDCYQNHAVVSFEAKVPFYFDKDDMEDASKEICIEKFGDNQIVEVPKP